MSILVPLPQAGPEVVLGEEAPFVQVILASSWALQGLLQPEWWGLGGAGPVLRAAL